MVGSARGSAAGNEETARGAAGPATAAALSCAVCLRRPVGPQVARRRESLSGAGQGKGGLWSPRYLAPGAVPVGTSYSLSASKKGAANGARIARHRPPTSRTGTSRHLALVSPRSARQHSRPGTADSQTSQLQAVRTTDDRPSPVVQSDEGKGPFAFCRSCGRRALRAYSNLLGSRKAAVLLRPYGKPFRARARDALEDAGDLAREWVRNFDRASGKAFYYNAHAGEALWEDEIRIPERPRKKRAKHSKSVSSRPASPRTDVPSQFEDAGLVEGDSQLATFEPALEAGPLDGESSPASPEISANSLSPRKIFSDRLNDEGKIQGTGEGTDEGDQESGQLSRAVASSIRSTGSALASTAHKALNISSRLVYFAQYGAMPPTEQGDVSADPGETRASFMPEVMSPRTSPIRRRKKKLLDTSAGPGKAPLIMLAEGEEARYEPDVIVDAHRLARSRFLLVQSERPEEDEEHGAGAKARET